MKKRRFSDAERYAVWLHRDKRCWFCEEPLRFYESTIDHVLPEELLTNVSELTRVLKDYGLPSNFKINGFENWLPCHDRCNRKKSKRRFKFAPTHRNILEDLMRDAKKVERAAQKLKANVTKDTLFAKIAVALEKKAISLQDLLDIATGLAPDTPDKNEPVRMIRLSTGYWIRQRDIVKVGICACEKQTCVDSDKKVECIFGNNLSEWVIKTGLYWKCYDEVIQCPRCNQSHRRGDIGREKRCSRPYVDQQSQRD